ncbi:unnamed protein product, partial [Prorocentrum cordatum]
FGSRGSGTSLRSRAQVPSIGCARWLPGSRSRRSPSWRQEQQPSQRTQRAARRTRRATGLGCCSRLAPARGSEATPTRTPRAGGCRRGPRVPSCLRSAARAAARRCTTAKATRRAGAHLAAQTRTPLPRRSAARRSATAASATRAAALPSTSRCLAPRTPASKTRVRTFFSTTAAARLVYRLEIPRARLAARFPLRLSLLIMASFSGQARPTRLVPLTGRSATSSSMAVDPQASLPPTAGAPTDASPRPRIPGDPRASFTGTPAAEPHGGASAILVERGCRNGANGEPPGGVPPASSCPETSQTKRWCRHPRPLFFRGG